MSPEAHTVYALLLFFALLSLMHWSSRRHRVARNLRHGVSAALVTPERDTGWLSPVA